MGSAPPLLSGHCLCGAVTFTARPLSMNMDACHCRMCRRWTGGPWLTVACDPEVEIAPQAPVKTMASSDWAERSFCGACGTALFWRMRDGSLFTVSAQAFDEPEQFAFVEEIFIDEKPANYSFANATHKMTGAEVIEKFLSSKD